MRNLPPLRSFGALVALLLFLTHAAACGSNGDAPDEPSDSNGDTPAQGYASALPDPSATPAAPVTRIDVKGFVATDLDDPAGARLVVLVDAEGKRSDVLTDDSGAFDVRDIVAPYDLLVAGADEAVAPKTVYFGVRRSDPFLLLTERGGAPPLLQPQETVHVTLEEGCTDGDDIRVVSTTPHGQGNAAIRCGASNVRNVPIALDVVHAWTEIWVDPSERIEVSLLVSNAAHDAFRMAHGFVTRTQGSESASMSFPAAASIDSAGPLRVTCHGVDDALPDWTWSTRVQLSALPFATFGAGRGTVLVPRIAGWNAHATLTASHTRPSARGERVERSIEAWSGDESIAGESVAPLDVAMPLGGPEMQTPDVDGVLSRRGNKNGSFLWTAAEGAPNALYELTVADTKRSRVRFRVTTVDHEIRLRRLRALGVERFGEGAHELRLSTLSNAVLEDVISPDETTRMEARTRRRAGWSTSMTIPFMVTP